MAKKSATARAAGPSPVRTLLGMFRAGRWAALALLVLAFAVGAWLTLWDHVHEHVVSTSQYQLKLEDLAVTPQPAWIHTDVKAEVFRDASHDAPLSILDNELCMKLAQAFGAHPWVAKAMRVTKHSPARVDAELIYRQPVAMIEVNGGLLPVDAEGILLPSTAEDFSPDDAKTYPRVTGINSSPVGSAGTAWGDGRVNGAAQIAAVLGRHWRGMKLDHIMPSASRIGVRTTNDIVYEVYAQSGTRIIWGHSPTTEVSGEMRTAAKVTELIKRLRASASVEGNNDDIDLTGIAEPLVPVRPPIKPLPLPEETGQ